MVPVRERNREKKKEEEKEENLEIDQPLWLLGYTAK